MPKLNIIQKNIQQVAANLESKLGASPVSPLRIVADGVASSHPEKYQIMFNMTILVHTYKKGLLKVKNNIGINFSLYSA